MQVGRWIWREQARLVGVGLIVAWTLVPLLTVFWMEPATRDLPVAAMVADLTTYPALLMGALLLYVHTRVSPGIGSARLAAATVFLTSQGIAYAVLRLAMPEGTHEHPGWLMLLDLVVAGLLVGMLAVSDRRPVGDPLLVGLGLGVVISALRLLLVTSAYPLPNLQGQTPWLGVLVLILYAVAAVLLVRRVSLPSPAGFRLGVVLVLLGLSHMLTNPIPPADARSLVAIVADLVGAVLFCTTAWALLQEALRQSARSELLQELLDLAEAEVRQDRTVLHQVASAAAGISSASQLLASGAVGDADARQRMVQMLAAESARLQRLSAGGPDDEVREIDLDQTIAPMVAAHAARGRTVEWQPCGHHAQGSPDRVAEVVGILLDNCADHSGTSTARVEVSDRSDGTVAITVSDGGRGIGHDVLARGFAWGARGRDSNGQGIGLHHAGRLATDLGGSLAVTGSPGLGTSVTLTLPAVAAAVLGGESLGA